MDPHANDHETAMDRPGPTISIITSVLNGANSLPRYLASLAGQTWEWIDAVVIDGGSEDGTVDLLAEHGHLLAYWSSRPDRGIYHAWNRGLEHATGDWVCFLGADDYLFSPDALARVAPRLRGAAADVVYGRVCVVDTDGNELYMLGEAWETAGPRMRHNMALPNPGTFYRRELFDRLGGLDEAFSIAGDYEFALRALDGGRGEAEFVADVVVAGMLEGGASDDVRYAVRVAREVERARRKHGLTRLPEWLAPRLLRIRLHRMLARLTGERTARRLVNATRRLRGLPPLSERTHAP
jgi:glycosyltransferase involved in cell wall biosynthesis